MDFNDLTYHFKDLRILPVGFIKFKGPFHIFKSARNGNIPSESVENEPKNLKKN